MTDTTHECPAPECDRRVPFEQFACRTHWFSIAGQLRRELLREWRDHPGEDSYFRVRARCLLALGVPAADIPGMNGGIAVP